MAWERRPGAKRATSNREAKFLAEILFWNSIAGILNASSVRV